MKQFTVNMMLSASLLLSFFASGTSFSDSDDDGVPDVKDACLQSQEGVLVNASGCDALSGGDDVCLLTRDNQLYPATCTVVTPLMFHFEFAKADVMFIQWQVFARMKRFLLRYNVNLCLLGHTDSVGSEASNRQLSYLRALNVKRVFVEDFGFNSERFIIKAMADSLPVASNEFSDGRAANRRVELLVELK